MKIVHTEASWHDVMRFFVDAYKLPAGEKVESFKTFISPDGERVVFKLYVSEAPHV